MQEVLNPLINKQVDDKAKQSSNPVCCERGFIVELFLFCELACEESGIDRIVHGAK